MTETAVAQGEGHIMAPGTAVARAIAELALHLAKAGQIASMLLSLGAPGR